MQVKAKVNLKWEEKFYTKGDKLGIRDGQFDSELFEEIVMPKKQEKVIKVTKPRRARKVLAK